MPDLITDFTVIRHGQTSANALHIIQGQSNTQLDETGRMQARCAAERLKDTFFDLVFCSDLDRTKETAQILLTRARADRVICVPALREWDLGELEGVSIAEARAKYPTLFTGSDGLDPDLQIKDGESRRDLYNRVAGFLEETAAVHAGKKILLVTHAGPLRAMFRVVAGGPLPHTLSPRVDNVSYNRFQRKLDHWQLISWNDTAHLAQMEKKETQAL